MFPIELDNRRSQKTEEKFVAVDLLKILAKQLTYNNNFKSISISLKLIPAGNEMFKVSNKNSRTRCEIFSKLAIITS